jgi:hypothetical protein
VKDVGAWVQALKESLENDRVVMEWRVEKMSSGVRGVCDYLIGSPLLASRVRK